MPWKWLESMSHIWWIRRRRNWIGLVIRRSWLSFWIMLMILTWGSRGRNSIWSPRWFRVIPIYLGRRYHRFRLRSRIRICLRRGRLFKRRRIVWRKRVRRSLKFIVNRRNQMLLSLLRSRFSLSLNQSRQGSNMISCRISGRKDTFKTGNSSQKPQKSYNSFFWLLWARKRGNASTSKA